MAGLPGATVTGGGTAFDIIGVPRLCSSGRKFVKQTRNQKARRGKRNEVPPRLGRGEEKKKKFEGEAKRVKRGRFSSIDYDYGGQGRERDRH